MKAHKSNFGIHFGFMVLFAWSGMIPLVKPTDSPCGNPDIKYDYIVVGAGSTGATVAARLSEDPDVQVLLLEAGGKPLPESFIPLLSHKILGSEMDWKYKTVPQSQCCGTFSENRVPMNRGKVLGGTSSINFMFYQRPNKADMNHWAALGNRGWNYESIFPYLQKLEDFQVPATAEEAKYHSQGGPVTVTESTFKSEIARAFMEAGEELGFQKVDYNGKQVSGFDYLHTTIRNGSRCSTYTSYLLPAMDRPNLQVVTNALVTQILFDKKKRATGVLFKRKSTLCTAKTSKEVIVSGGAINSPQLLMLSGIGPKAELDKFDIPLLHDLPGVGKNFQDHLVVGGQMFFMNQSVTMNPAIYETEEYEQLWQSTRSGPLTVPLSCEAIAFFSTKHNDKNDDDWTDGEIALCSGGISRIAIPYLKALYNLALPSVESEMINFVPIGLKLKSRGTLTLNSKDPQDPPNIDPNYLSHPDDLEVLVEVIKTVVNITETKAFQKYEPSRPYYGILPQCLWYGRGSDDYYRCGIKELTTTGFHPSSTCKMGVKSDPLAVVDNKLRVYGVKGLRVADASIMPVLVAGHPSVTCIMIGEKLADMLKQDRNLEKQTLDSNGHCDTDSCRER